MSSQATLDGATAERVECEYYDGCHQPALYIAEILHYGDGEKPVRMCESCKDEHLEDPNAGAQRLKPEDRYVTDAVDETDSDLWIVVTNYTDDPHPHIDGVFDDRSDADDLLDDCRAVVGGPNPVAWTLFRVNRHGFEQVRP